MATKPIGITEAAVFGLLLTSLWLLHGCYVAGASPRNPCAAPSSKSRIKKEHWLTFGQRQAGAIIFAHSFWDLSGKGMLSSVQLLGSVRLFATPWTTALQASLSITNSELTQTHVQRISDAIQPFHKCWVQEILEIGVQFLKLIQCCKSAHFNKKVRKGKKKGWGVQLTLLRMVLTRVSCRGQLPVHLRKH